MVAAIAFAVWTRHTNACIAQAEFPLVDLRLSDPQTVFWYFGDWHYRLSPAIWGKACWRILNGCFGSLVLVGLLGYALLFGKRGSVSKYWLLGSVLTTMIFSHLVLHHRHYYLMFSPAIAMLCAQAVVNFEDLAMPSVLSRERLWVGAVAILLGLSLIQGLLVQNGGWGGNQFLLTNRDGLSIWGTEFLENPANLARIKELGYNKLVMISESPLLHAVQVINPGQARLARLSRIQRVQLHGALARAGPRGTVAFAL